MTLAIGAKYPWGELNKLFAPTAKPPDAIILASDSRWTYRSEAVPYQDIGTKLFSIGKHVGAVYAGGSQVGEECLDELRWQLRRQKGLGSQLGRDLAQKAFRGVYKTYLASKKWNPDECPLYILIGACNTLGEAELCLFEYQDDFMAKSVEGIKAIGMDNAVKQFDSILKNELKKQVDGELSLRRRWSKIAIADLVPMPIKPHHVAIFITSSLHNIVESQFDETVGGKIQCAVITTEGISLPKISYTPDPTNEGPGFTRVTPRLDELRTLTGIFGCYDISD
jgi:hypothetical protein